MGDAGAVPLLMLCFQEPELTLKRISASALSDISKHSPELAQTVVDAGAVSLLAKDISHIDAKLKRQVCSCLSQIAKHSVDLTEMVVEAEIFPRSSDKCAHACRRSPSTLWTSRRWWWKQRSSPDQATSVLMPVADRQALCGPHGDGGGSRDLP